MPVPENKAVIEKPKPIVTRLKVMDVKVWNESEDKGTFIVEYPFKIEISKAKKDKKMGEVVVESRRTTKTLTAKSWNKKFYVKNDNVAFTWDHSLLALVTIMLKKGDLEAKQLEKFNVNDLIDYEFDGVVREGISQSTGNNYMFIDWVTTFEVNGVRVPNVDELGGSRKVVEEVKKEEVKTNKVDPNDLPW